MDEETRRAFLVRYAALAMTATAATVPLVAATAAENALPAQQRPSPPTFAPPEPPRVVALYGPQSPGTPPPLEGSERFRVLYGPPSVGDRPRGPISPAPSEMEQITSPK